MHSHRVLSRLGLVALLVALLSVALPVNADAPIHLTEIGRYTGTGAEISAFDATTNRLYVTGSDTVQVVDLTDPAHPVLVGDCLTPRPASRKTWSRSTSPCRLIRRWRM